MSQVLMNGYNFDSKSYRIKFLEIIGSKALVVNFLGPMLKNKATRTTVSYKFTVA